MPGSPRGSRPPGSPRESRPTVVAARSATGAFGAPAGCLGQALPAGPARCDASEPRARAPAAHAWEARDLWAGMWIAGAAGMSEARRLVPSQTHFLTRRTRNRCAFLRPAEDVNQLVLYCLGRAQQLAPGVQLHALMVSTTHTHAGVTDAPAESQLPRLQQNLHSLLARSLNSYYGRGENFWTTCWATQYTTPK